uniref:Uncharacterized protein n=1 Tax=viral metagenome TaxID=1070528 RepID=A0A6C0C8S2_9ZZZZ
MCDSWIRVDSNMCVYENSCLYTNFNLASSIFDCDFDRKTISSVSIIKKGDESIDINIVFGDGSCCKDGDNIVDVVNSVMSTEVNSVLCVKTNDCNLMKMNLTSSIFNSIFRCKTIISVDLFKNYNNSVNFDIAYQPNGPIMKCKPVDSRMCVKNSASNILRFNLASSVFDNVFDLKPILCSEVVKKRDGSIDVNITFQSCTITKQHFPSNPAYNGLINNPIYNSIYYNNAYTESITS